MTSRKRGSNDVGAIRGGNMETWGQSGIQEKLTNLRRAYLDALLAGADLSILSEDGKTRLEMVGVVVCENCGNFLVSGDCPNCTNRAK